MDQTPVSLLDQLHGPDPTAAWGRFVHLYTPLLVHWAARAGVPEADRPDLIQDVFVTLLRVLPSFTYDRGRSFRAWLYTVFANKWKDTLRKKVPVTLAADGSGVVGPMVDDPIPARSGAAGPALLRGPFMATLFKPTRPYPLPANPELVHKDGKPHVRVKDRGKTVLYPLSEDGTQYLKPAAKWAADVRFGYTLSETGTLSSTLVDVADTVVGSDTQTLTVGSDAYTLGETGTLTGGSFDQGVTGTESDVQTQTGNPQAGSFVRGVTGTGSYTATETGSGATKGPGGGTYTYGESETASPLAGRFSLAMTGTDRYDLLEQFDDVSDSGSGAAPGHMNFSPFGTPFPDPDQYARNFWGSFSAETMNNSEHLRAAKSFYHIHHTKAQFFESVYAARGIDIHAAENLVGVHPTVNADLREMEKAWIQAEMKKINPAWRYGNAKDNAAFLKAIEKDDEFFKRLESFSQSQHETYKKYFIRAGASDAKEIKSIYQSMEGAKRVNSFKASAASRAKKLLPKAAGALAFLALFAPLEVAIAGHTPEQQAAFDKFYGRYQGLYRGAIEGRQPDQLQFGLLKDEWIAYMRALGIDDAVVGVTNAQLEKAIADK